MAKPMIGHRSKDASALQGRISDKMRVLWSTQHEILLSTSSGSGLMEGAIRSCTARRAAVFSVGAFGKRWFEMAVSNNIPADLYEVEWGKAITPDMIDEALSSGKYDLITVTHNETSTGVMNPVQDIAAVVKNYPEVVYCLDTVSSTGGTPIQSMIWGLTSASLPPKGPGPARDSYLHLFTEGCRAGPGVPCRGYYLDLCSSINTSGKGFCPPSFYQPYVRTGLSTAAHHEEGLENRYQAPEMAECESGPGISPSLLMKATFPTP